MKKIPLTRGYSVKVDDEDYQKLSKFKWHYNNGYACRRLHKKVAYKKYKGEYIYMHRLIMKHPELGVDHVNGDSLDNQRKNLRVADQSDNMCNQHKARHNKYGYKGIYFAKDRKKFAARVTYRKKKHILGYYDTAKEAAISYNEGAIKYHKQFARLNNV